MAKRVNVCLAHPNSVEAIVKKPLISVVNKSLAVIGYWDPELLLQISCDWVTQLEFQAGTTRNRNRGGVK